MNYFAHGRRYLTQPYLLAGTAVPDWLSVVDRRARIRPVVARRFLPGKDQRMVALACGVLQHYRDDDWFHRTRAFAELQWTFTAALRDQLAHDPSLRPSFLGHILVELLLDATLIEVDPSALDDYYRAFDQLDPHWLAWGIERMTGRPMSRLAEFIGRFSEVRFLYDYAEDAKLLYRLNMVMRRVRLPALPDQLCEWLPTARQLVRQRSAELLDPSSVVSPIQSSPRDPPHDPQGARSS